MTPDENALITLKKGSKLIKYSRKGKPKIRTFRLSSDETALIWYSHKREKFLRLSSVSKVIPGQRTVCLLLSELNVKILLASIYIASTTADMVRGACKVQ